MIDPVFKRADELFDAALDLPARDRAAWLEGECGDDVALRELVERLLDGADDDGELIAGAGLEGPLLQSLADELTTIQPLQAGDRLGPWRIGREIGRGGMAVVYQADRADGQFEQRAALKVMQHDADSGDVARRFRQERQILARAHHPGIARLLDGGVTPDGRPWFAMEYVEGQRIDRYCDENRLDVEQRLKLFLQVARAVEYAHRNMVVHRDLKPGNILVTERGEAKLLDFGIAKWLSDDAEATGASMARFLTPAWASPEQVLGAPVTLASDVYQLGLLLYRLLVGGGPWPDAAGRGVELARAVCETPPASPTAVLTPAPDDTTRLATVLEAAKQRRTTPSRLKRRLRGDLDAIALKALQREPERRYRSAGRMVEDIERHLVHRPVSARAPTASYLASRYARRHAAWVAVLVASTFGVLGLLAVQTGQLRRERAQAQAAARYGAVEADVVRALLGPARERPEREAVERQLAALADDPMQRAEQLAVIGSAYVDQGAPDVGEPLLRSALLFLEVAPDGGGPAAGTARRALGEVLAQRGEADEARALLRRARDELERALGANHPETRRAVEALAKLER